MSFDIQLSDLFNKAYIALIFNITIIINDIAIYYHIDEKRSIPPTGTVYLKRYLVFSSVLTFMSTIPEHILKLRQDYQDFHIHQNDYHLHL